MAVVAPSSRCVGEAAMEWLSGAGRMFSGPGSPDSARADSGAGGGLKLEMVPGWLAGRPLRGLCRSAWQGG